MSEDGSSRLPGLHALDVNARRAQVASSAGVAPGDLGALDRGGLDLDAADSMIENVIGTFALPLGIAPNFLVDGVDYLVPMVTEEASVVAAAANAARMVRAGGGLRTGVSPPIMTRPVPLPAVADPAAYATAANRLTRDMRLQSLLCIGYLLVTTLTA